MTMMHRLGRMALIFGLLLISNTFAQAKNSFALLAVSWQPAFCEQRPKRPECATQTTTRYDATHFSLHGLWPGPRSNSYCNINSTGISTDKSGRWGKLPDLRLEASLMSRLNQVMPGTKSYLHRHEWIKHGSCHENGSTNGYYEDSLRLMNALNSSEVRKLFSDNIGVLLKTSDIQSAFDTAFGKGAGDRIRIKCKLDGKRNLIQEITIGLYGKFDEEHSFTQLIQAARPTKPGCAGGIIDPAGFQ